MWNVSLQPLKGAVPCPADNLGVRLLMGDISLMTGDTKTAMKSYLKEAATSPAHWYQAGQIAFRDGDFVSACTYKVLVEVQPESMLVLGDTNSCLAVIPAKRRQIPIFHMEAGNRFDQRVGKLVLAATKVLHRQPAKAFAGSPFTPSPRTTNKLPACSSTFVL